MPCFEWSIQVELKFKCFVQGWLWQEYYLQVFVLLQVCGWWCQIGSVPAAGRVGWQQQVAAGGSNSSRGRWRGGGGGGEVVLAAAEDATTTNNSSHNTRAPSWPRLRAPGHHGVGTALLATLERLHCQDRYGLPVSTGRGGLRGCYRCLWRSLILGPQDGAVCVLAIFPRAAEGTYCPDLHS